jgi:type VI secretion system protein ImpJ
MAVRPVHWHEGMFLRPHHFQAAQRHTQYLTHLGEKWDHHYNWGLGAADVDLDALANHRLVVRGLKARLRDGSLVSIPEEGTLPTLDLQTAFEGTTNPTVFLAVPVANLGQANVCTNGHANGARFRLDVQELEDENTGVNPQPIQVRLLNLKLLLDRDDRAGYDVLPLCRIHKSATAEATPELDVSYIPPLLACEAWQPLRAGILQQVYDRIGQRLQLLAELVVSRGITFDSQAAGDPQIFAQLRVLNEAYALLGILCFADGVHPLPAYLELCRLVGQLSIFGTSRRVPDLPKYDHDDLGGCFYRVKQYIDALFENAPQPNYKERPFVGAGLRMQVALEPSWLESVYEMYVGVRSTLPAEECVRLLTKAGQLDMKIGSSDRADDIYRLGMAGLRFAHSPRPPRALPSAPGLIYFQVDRGSQQGEWQNVQKSLTLAIRLNENRIAGDIQGRRVLTIKTGNSQTTDLQFTLYVVAQEQKPAAAGAA